MHSARVLIDGPSELVFDYAVPAGMAVAPGCRVRVPLRAKSSTGTVLALVDDPQPGFALREIAALTDPEPLITPVLLEIGRWIADYYGCRMETVMRALLPEAVRTEDHGAKTRRLAELTAAPPADELARLAGRAPRQHAIVSLLESAAGRRIAVADLGEGAAAALRGLVARGWVAIVEEAVHRDPEADSTTLVETTPLALTDEQAAALEVVRSAIDNPQSPIPNPQSPIRNPQYAIPNHQTAIRNPQSQVPRRSCCTG
jgi:primosomal protein N' (replication factor Y)